ncbi:MAG: Gfo/Idh/MocA family oxidoreductase [Verrucomicrobiota bacterium]
MSHNKPLNVGLIGGGGGAFIAQPHQKAINMDGTRRVVAAALTSNAESAMEQAENWPYPIKGYRSYTEMIETQANLPEEERIDYVVIVTPNHVHLDPALQAIKAGIPVFCEKPLTVNVEEANKLVAAVEKKKIPFGVSHTYIGHWTSWFSRYIVHSGLIGDVLWADAYYLQGWLATRTEETGCMQAEWRVDPKRAGGSCCGGDIGTHALMQLRFVTGLEVTQLSAHMETMVEGRQLDDHFTAYCKLNNGAKALVRASQVSIGHKNNLGLEVVGSKGTLRWEQENPECVTIYLQDQPERQYWRGSVSANDGFLGNVPQCLLDEPTIPSGHPEGLHDAFARLHRSFEEDVRKYKAGQEFNCDGSKYANIHDGQKGMAFINACLRSQSENNSWVDM